MARNDANLVLESVLNFKQKNLNFKTVIFTCARFDDEMDPNDVRFVTGVCFVFVTFQTLSKRLTNLKEKKLKTQKKSYKSLLKI